jgi:hypothetical protein
MKLYRPVGLKEMELIAQANYRAYPPRLEGQPIFYPVLNFEYAAQIAHDWNTQDAFSGYIGFVTSFLVDDVYISQFEIHNVGGVVHDEYWVPASELANFNTNILEDINIESVYYGGHFEGVVPNLVKERI